MRKEQKVLDVRKISRTVNQNGTVGYKITIPAEWIEKHNLEDGKHHNVIILEDEESGNLIIQPISTYPNTLLAAKPTFKGI